jgi:hypothetical protein
MMKGPLPAKLGNGISDAIHAALEKGMQTDEACCVAIAVIADYARMEYGTAYLQDLADVLIKRAFAPMPEDRANG